MGLNILLRQQRYANSVTGNYMFWTRMNTVYTDRKKEFTAEPQRTQSLKGILVSQ